jgi:type II secretory ATPase GspE/PulE/Tfp pilus assembly ATPase PilB-like protein
MGVRPEVMAGNIIGILAQRLVRKLKQGCREAYPPSRIERQILGLDAASAGETIFRVAEEFQHAEHQGYAGRVALMELLKFDREMDELIARGATVRELTDAARRNGFKSLAEVAVHRVLQGITTIDEVSRVVDLTDRVA